MPWQCRLVDDHDERTALKRDGRLPVGTMWHHFRLYPPAGSVRAPNTFLSPEYYRDWLGKRPALWVVLPCGCHFCLDSRASKEDTGWTITGSAPNVSATPSIDQGATESCSGYHGFLTAGVLSDDVSGRRYGG